MYLLFCLLSANLMTHLRYIGIYSISFILDTTGQQPLSLLHQVDRTENFQAL